MKLTHRQLKQLIKEELRTEPYTGSEMATIEHPEWGPIGDYSGTALVLPPDPNDPARASWRGLKGVEWDIGEPQWRLTFSQNNTGYIPWVISMEMAQEFTDDPVAAVRKYWKTINHATDHAMGDHGSEIPSIQESMNAINPKSTILKDNNMKNREIRATIQELIKEIREERVGSSPSEPKHLSEARKYVRNAINEMMVGLTPITRIDAQGNANNASKGDNTNSAIDKAEIGFNTFDMQEWASIAGITENTDSDDDDGIWSTSGTTGADDEKLEEHWEDDGYGSNVIDLLNADSDEVDEVPEMWTTDSPCLGSEDLAGDDMVGDTELGFEKFMQGMGNHENGCGCNQCEEKHGDADEDEDEFNFTGDVGELDGDSAFAIGLEAGKRGLDDDEPRG